MTVRPEECLAPSEEDLNTVTDLTELIDFELKQNFTRRDALVFVRTTKINSRINAKVTKLITDQYTAVGWTVVFGNDSYGDPRDGTSGGGPYISFTA